MRCFPLVALLALLPSTALGVSFSVPLPDLVGSVGYPAAIEANFDFGQQFSQIENVWIEIEAKVFAGQFDVCGTVSNPQPCVHEVILLGFFARLDKEDTPALGTVFSEGLSYSDDRHALEGSGVDTGAFNARLGFDFLLDGRGSLTLFWNDISGDPDRIIENVILPSGEIFNARLAVEGSPVPEPSTALLFASGLVLLRTVRRGRTVTSSLERKLI